MDPTDFELSGAFYLGGQRHQDRVQPTLLDSRDLRTHAVCVGMTGSGKTGLGVILLEEAAIDGIPSIVIDPKGDMGNLMLTFDELTAEQFEPWIPAEEAARKGTSVQALAEKTAATWTRGLASWGQDAARIRRLRAAADMQIFTPGSASGRPISLLRDFREPGDDVLGEPDTFRDLLLSTTESLLALIGEHSASMHDPATMLISSVLQHFWTERRSPSVVDLIRAVQEPPFTQLGVMDVDTVIPPKERMRLAMGFNALVASPAFAAWTEGEPFDIDSLLFAQDGTPRISILNIAHLGEAERMFFVTRFYNDLLAWTRRQTGTTALRALIYMDEVAGYLPPVAQPPSKRPIMTLLKQARAYGVGLVMATQNPADLDYKALSNMGTWMIGRLQTNQDRDRLLDGMNLEGDAGTTRATLDQQIAALKPREFVLHSARGDAPEVFETRWALSYLRGPLTRAEVRRLVDARKGSAETRPRTTTDAADHRNPDEASVHHESGSDSRSARGRAANSSAAETRRGSPTHGARPLLDAAIAELFVPLTVPASPDVRLLAYRPMVFADVTVDFSKEGVSRGFSLLARPEEDTDRLDWGVASRVGWTTQALKTKPPESAVKQQFLDVPRPMFRPAFYRDQSSALQDWLYRNETLTTWYNRSLREGSQSGESREAFAQRMATVAREQRDGAVDALETKFRSRFDRLRDRLELAEHKAAEQASDVETARMNAAVDIGGTLFGMLAGRRRSTRSARSSAARVQREQAQAERARLKVHQLRDELAALDREFRAELAEIEARYSGQAANNESSQKTPLKRDCLVRRVALVWVPYWRMRDGRIVRAWDAATLG